MVIGKPLFCDGDLDSYLRAQVEAVGNHVRERVRKDDLVKTDAELAHGMMPEAKVNPLIIDFDNPTKTVSEARIQVNDMLSGRRVTIDGVRAMRSFSFTGDVRLFTLRTNPYTTTVPHGEVRSGRVTIGLEGRNDAERLKSELDRQESGLREYVNWSKTQIDAHNSRLIDLLTAAVAARRQHLASIDDLASKI